MFELSSFVCFAAVGGDIGSNEEKIGEQDVPIDNEFDVKEKFTGKKFHKSHHHSSKTVVEKNSYGAKQVGLDFGQFDGYDEEKKKVDYEPKEFLEKNDGYDYGGSKKSVVEHSVKEYGHKKVDGYGGYGKDVVDEELGGGGYNKKGVSKTTVEKTVEYGHKKFDGYGDNGKVDVIEDGGYGKKFNQFGGEKKIVEDEFVKGEHGYGSGQSKHTVIEKKVEEFTHKKHTGYGQKFGGQKNFEEKKDYEPKEEIFDEKKDFDDVKEPEPEPEEKKYDEGKKLFCF